jgi:hypothetical protein
VKIAILGWGSLVWDPQELAYDGIWRTGGPNLPIEFSRISSDGRLTLVIDRNNGQIMPTQYTTSTMTTLAEAVENLRLRESTSIKYIGYIDLQNGTSRLSQTELAVQIKPWAQEYGFSAVVWTALPPRFRIGEKEVTYSVNGAIGYLQSLPDHIAERASEYISKAPPEVNTPLRRRLLEIGWLNEEKV